MLLLFISIVTPINSLHISDTHLPDIKIPPDGHKWKHDISKLPHTTTYTSVSHVKLYHSYKRTANITSF